jgi:uncharacterized protein (DUF58 family)
VRPTRNGVVVLVLAPALAVLAWMFGQPELAVLAATAGAALAVAALVVRLAPMRIEVRRSVRPGRLPVGDPCQVVLRVRNVGPVRTPVLTLHDDVGRFGHASMQLAPLPPGATRDASYLFPSHRRGLHPVGPLTVDIEDPFGLVRTTRDQPGRQTVIVLPRTWPLTPLPPAPGDEPERGVRALASNSTVDEEFAALRPYAPGDDIRRIHWRTTARLGSPVVRQFDQPWQLRTTVLLDVRRSAHDADSFERAVSAAASVVTMAAARDELVRLVTTAGVDSGFVPAPDRFEELMDRLAEVGPDTQGSLTGTVAHLSRRPTGRLVTVAGTLEASEHGGLVRGSRLFGLHVLVVTGRLVASDGPGGPVVVLWTEGDDLTGAWSTGLSGVSAAPTGVPA